MKSEEIAAMIDHTILSAEATIEEVKQRCEEAKEYKFASVCVNPYFIDLVNKELAGSSIKTCTVIGFPLGSNTTEAKVFATRNAIKRGAEEIDMVINIGAVKSNAWNIVEHDIKSVVREASGKALVKVIIETCYLTDKEKRKVCEIAKKVGADFVKTSTGFGEYGARVEDIKLMKEVVGDDLGIKASGGIRNRADALKMIEAGATRIGASSGKEIIGS